VATPLLEICADPLPAPVRLESEGVLLQAVINIDNMPSKKAVKRVEWFILFSVWDRYWYRARTLYDSLKKDTMQHHFIILKRAPYSLSSS
jgi:hypothetical protein